MPILPKYHFLVKEAEAKLFSEKKIELCGQLLSLGASLTEQCNRNLTQFGLLDGRFATLLVLKHLGQGQPNHLATAVGLTRASMTAILDFLERNEYVTRVPSIEDRRAINIVLQDRAHKEIEEVIDFQLAWLESLTVDLSDIEMTQLSELLVKIDGSLRKNESKDRDQ
ncbi:MAG: MarR family winged helix-turn-helix transcriptional regulator [Pseudomonadota bacterium]|nr:MarR family winged helix-turn-helix transcriptional regulator [Pseudomonadota bacterium]